MGFPARLPDIEPLCRRGWASSTREGQAGGGRLLSAVSWLQHVGFLHGSNDQVWRESSLDSSLAACTCLSCWPLASAPELSGEKRGAFYVTASLISSHRNRDMNSSPDGRGPWDCTGVKCPHSPLTGASPSALQLEDGESRDCGMTPALSKGLTWNQVRSPFKT